VTSSRSPRPGPRRRDRQPQLPVRYQDFTGPARTRSRATALRAGVTLTGLASSWSAFTVHAALFLKPGGRRGLVLPGAAQPQLRRAGPPLPPGALHHRGPGHVHRTGLPRGPRRVVLLMADGYQQGPPDHANIYQVHNAADLTQVPAGRAWTPRRPQDKWPHPQAARAPSAQGAGSSGPRRGVRTHLDEVGRPGKTTTTTDPSHGRRAGGAHSSGDRAPAR